MKVIAVQAVRGLWFLCLENAQGKRLPITVILPMPEWIAKAKADTMNARPWT